MGLSRVAPIGLCLLLIASGIAAEVIERDFQRTFDVETGDRLHLDHGDGDVVIEAWDQDKVDVKVRYLAEYKRIGVGSEIDFDVEFRQTGSTVHVIGRESGNWSIGFFSFKESDYLYTVRAPAYLMLDLEGEDGDVELSDWQGEIEIRTEDGDIDLTGISAPKTDLSAEDGDITIDRLTGKLVVVTEDGYLRVSDCTITDGRFRLEDGDATFSRCEGSGRFELVDGDLALERFRPDGIDIRTEDGDVELDFLPSAAMNVVVRTHDGDVTVDLAQGSSAEFTIDTDDGGIRLDTPGAVDVRERRSSASGTLGTGEGKLRIESGDGRVVLRGKS